MKLSQLAAKPTLIEITLDDQDTVSAYGETLSFWTWDRQPLDVFMRLATAQTSDPTVMIALVNQLMLDENGEQIIKDDVMLPSDVLIRAIGKLTERLGN